MITKDNVPFLIYTVALIIAVAVYAYMETRDRRAARAAAYRVDGVDCFAGEDSPEANIQPIMRREPDFQNIYKREYIVLEFDLTIMGAVEPPSIQVLETTSQRLIPPAVLAIAQWSYCPQVRPGQKTKRKGIRVAFNVQPPETSTPYDFWDRE